MSALFVLIPVSLALLGLALLAFRWAVNSGQFDDLDRGGASILLDDEDLPRPERE